MRKKIMIWYKRSKGRHMMEILAWSGASYSTIEEIDEDTYENMWIKAKPIIDFVLKANAN